MKYDNDYKGEERRKNNGKIRFTARDWYFILTIIIGATLWLGKLQWASMAQAEKIKKVEKAPMDIALIQKDISQIQKDFSEFKTEQKEVNKKLDGKLDKILDKL